METRGGGGGGGGGRHTDLWRHRGSEVENGDVEKVTEAFCLVQVVYVVMVTGWGGQAEERREHWRQRDRRRDEPADPHLVLNP